MLDPKWTRSKRSQSIKCFSQTISMLHFQDRIEIKIVNKFLLCHFSEPKYRGVMIAYSAITGTLGMLFVFVLNILMPWRTAAMVCMFVPILTIVALCFVSTKNSS